MLANLISKLWNGPSRFRIGSILCLCLIAVATCPSQARPKRSDPGPHPLKLIKFVKNDNERSMGSATGSYEVWIQNTSEYIVDKIRVDVEIYDREGRYLDKVSKDVGKLTPGQKKIFEMRYSVMGTNENVLTPRLWFYYNAGKEKLTQFEVNTANM